MIEIEIDGKKIETDSGAMIIEAADNAGIYIPRFCYHKKLSIAANCRMCLVEVEKSPKPLPACATPVTDGMKVMTQSTKALEAQRYVMEFLLINHPLDCPICDQGGECELQDISMGFGRDDSSYTEKKRSVDDDDLGPLIATDMTRCIQCTRCVRFGQEIAGIRELGLLNRSNETQISTYVKHSLTSELSGNIIDLCPVGALTSKPFRFRARAWELTQHESIAPHDCVGSNLFIHTRNGTVMRVVPHANESINETWISDRDRFSYLGLHHKDRLSKPMIKHQGQWQEVDWTKAFEYAAKGLKEIIREFGAHQLAAIISPNSTIEEGYLLQKIMQDLGSNNMDYRIQQQDFSDDETHDLLFTGTIEEFSKQNSILLIGSNIRREQPILSNRIRTSTQDNDATVASVNLLKVDYNFPVAADWVVRPEVLVESLTEIAKALGAGENEWVPAKIRSSLTNIEISASAEAIAKIIQKGEKKLIVLGAIALNHPQAALIRALARIIAKLIKANVAELPPGANAKGLASINVKSDNKGLNAWEMIQKKLKAYLLYNLEPEFDCTNPAAVRTALENASFVIAFSPYKSSLIEETADIILPIVPYSETNGSFMNVEGVLQTFKAVVPPLGEARPGWKVLRVFGNMLQLDGYQYSSSEEILNELQNHQSLSISSEIYDAEITKAELKNNLTRIGEWPLYRSDSIVRRAEALQLSGGNEPFAALINPETAEKLGLKELDEVKLIQAGNHTKAAVKVSKNIPSDCIYLANAHTESAKMGEAFGTIEVERIKVEGP